MRNRSLLLGWVLAAAFVPPGISHGTEPPRIVDLNMEEYRAVERLTQANVTGTLSFLAADELQGRGTPSPGLDIATAYAASRLQSAGTEGLGTDGSYYLESSIPTLRTAHASEVLTVEGSAALRLSLLEGGSAGLDYQGPFARASDSPEETFSGPVLLAAPQLEQPATAVGWLHDQTLRLQRRGATAVMVEAPHDSPLWALASARHDQPWLDTARNRFALPSLVVEAGKLADGSQGQLSIPPNTAQPSRVRNVAAVLRGCNPLLADEAIVFSAHIDHLGNGAPGADSIYNGADDDASGVTAVLCLADAFGAMDPAPQRSLVFIAFWGEELGLLGSQHLVRNSPWPLEKIVANINIEMIGRPEANSENRMWMTGWQESDLGQLMNLGSRRLAVETFDHPSFSAPLYRRSDNYSFAQQGVIAHSFSAGSLHEDYHQPSDEWHKMNLPHMTQVIRGLFAGALPIAQGTLTPRKATQELLK